MKKAIWVPPDAARELRKIAHYIKVCADEAEGAGLIDLAGDLDNNAAAIEKIAGSAR